MINLGSSVLEKECRHCGEVFQFTLAMLTRKAKFNCPHCMRSITLTMKTPSDVLEIPEEIKRNIILKDFNTRLN